MTPDRWLLATTAAAAMATDPSGLRGLIVRDRPGPVRDGFLDMLTGLLDRPLHRLPGTLDATALSPSLDLGETLRMGQEVYTQNLLTRAADRVLLVPMAERLATGTASIVASASDDYGPSLLLLDEGIEPDETVPQALSDRLAISLNFDGMARGDLGAPGFDSRDIRAARKRLADVEDGEATEALTTLAASLGIGSLRVPVLALKLARALAALDRAKTIAEPHIVMATLLCLAPRATVIPASDDEPEEAPPPPPEDEPQDREDKQSSEQGPLQDRVLEAVAAILPELVLTGTRQRGGAKSSGAGDRKKSASHGRPVRSRPGKPDGKRLDVFATLLTAAPWQPLRRRSAPDRKGLIVVPDDFRIKQYDRPTESVLIFLVDASGSQAAARMAEAKGAMELMLAEAYRRREKVALMAFRGTSADLILPPTRSLLQAKRRLAVLPGGGPTPLASALVAGREVAEQISRRGATPYLVLLTDGRGNIALDGTAGRAQAAEDQALAARALATCGITSALIDTANRPQADAQALAKTMGARYLALPRADAKGLAKIVRASVAA
ncbi:MAG: magnesium chelatase subunit D [Pseudomonadota bacterium]